MTTIDLPLLRNSERSAFKTCVRQWKWAWDFDDNGTAGLVPAMAKQDARWFGTGIHLALAEWYAPPKAKNGFVRGPDPRETFEKYCRNLYTTLATHPYFSEEGEKEYLDAKQLGRDMLAGYLETYLDDPTVEVIWAEQRYNTLIPYNARQKDGPVDFWEKVPDGKYIVKLAGTFDMVYRSALDGFVKCLDHKTARQRESGAHLVKDDQAGTYITVSTGFLRHKGILDGNETVVGMTYNYLRKGRRNPDDSFDDQGRKRNLPKKDHFARALYEAGAGTEAEFLKFTLPDLKDLAGRLKLTVYGDVSKTQPVPLFWREEVMRNRANRANQLVRIADDAEMIARTRAGELPITKSPGDHCAWCDFRDLCDIDEDGGDTQGFIKDVFVTRDPYADHRPGAQNSKTTVVADKTVKSNVTKVNFG